MRNSCYTSVHNL